MNKRMLRIEALIASPPTPKCEAILRMLEDISASYLDDVRVDIYLAGEQPGVTPTTGYQSSDKFRSVPSVYVNGFILSQGGAPDRSALESMVASELAKGPGNWQN